MGYLMVRFDRAWRKLDDVLSDRDRAAFAISRTWRDLVEIAISLAQLVDRVNRRGWIVGDLSADNVLVSDDGRAALVDCDDMVASDDPQDPESRPLTTERYGAWELHQSPPAKFSIHTDAWALGAIVIQLLQDGAHPFGGDGSAHHEPRGILQNLEEGHTRFSPPGSRPFERSPPGPSWLPIDTLPPRIVELARSCVVDGRTAPNRRPAASDWAFALQQIAYAGCADREGHVFSGHLQACPWCEHVHRGQRDPFAGARGGAR